MKASTLIIELQKSIEHNGGDLDVCIEINRKFYWQQNVSSIKYGEEQDEVGCVIGVY